MRLADESGINRWLLLAHVALLIFLWWMPLNAFSGLPDQIAVHFDSAGQPDQFEPRSGLKLWMVPFVGMFIGLGILILTLFPGLYDFPRKNEVKNWPEHLRLPVYSTIKEMLLAVLLCLDVMFVFIEYGIVASARNGHQVIAWAGIMIPALIPIALAAYYVNRINGIIERTPPVTDTRR